MTLVEIRTLAGMNKANLAKAKKPKIALSFNDLKRIQLYGEKGHDLDVKLVIH